MKKILLLNYEFPPLGGGASPVSYDIAEKLSQTKEFDIDVVTMKAKGLPGFEEINPNFRIHRVKCLRSKKEICYPWEQLSYLFSSLFFLNSFLKNRNFDVCHTHFIIPTGIISLWLKKRYKIPYVITTHGSDVPGYNPDRFKLLHRFTGPLIRLIIRHSDKIIAPSKYLIDLLKVTEHNLGEKGLIIPNGIDTNTYKSKRKDKIILSAGRLLERKGFHYLIRAVSDRNIGYEVHIAGDGPMREELAGLAKKSKTKIVFHGWLDNKKKEYLKLISRSEIFVLLSSSESFGMVLAESMSAKCAIITSNITGCAEVVSGAGLLVDPSSKTEVNKAINSLIKNKKLLISLQKKSYERVIKEYDWNVVICKYRKLLTSI